MLGSLAAIKNIVAPALHLGPDTSPAAERVLSWFLPHSKGQRKCDPGAPAGRFRGYRAAPAVLVGPHTPGRAIRRT
jgi:hypothetical protein